MEQEMNVYTVFGIYADNMQRHADHVTADNPVEAETKYRARMKRKGEDMLVAGVVLGKTVAVDQFDNAVSMDSYL
jgi:hypothetical protein